jgi:hypothetical protein
MKSTLKIVTFAPESHADVIRKAMGDAGAGVIGNYSYCTYSTKGIGRFKPLDGANPTVGTVGEIEAVAEERIETVCEREKIEQVVKAIQNNHPYEEVPIDVYEIELF